MNELAVAPGGEVIVYESQDGEARLDVRLDGETVWLTRRQMADVFRTTPRNIGMHLDNVYADGEIDREATRKDFFIVLSEGERRVRREVAHHNLKEFIQMVGRPHLCRQVICIEMRALLFKHTFLTGVNHRYTNPLSETGLPIGPVVSMGEIGQYECSLPNLIANYLVDQSGLSNVPGSVHLYVEGPSDRRLYLIRHDLLQLRISELHCHKAEFDCQGAHPLQVHQECAGTIRRSFERLVQCVPGIAPNIVARITNEVSGEVL